MCLSLSLWLAATCFLGISGLGLLLTVSQASCPVPQLCRQEVVPPPETRRLRCQEVSKALWPVRVEVAQRQGWLSTAQVFPSRASPGHVTRWRAGGREGGRQEQEGYEVVPVSRDLLASSYGGWWGCRWPWAPQGASSVAGTAAPHQRGAERPEEAR